MPNRIGIDLALQGTKTIAEPDTIGSVGIARGCRGIDRRLVQDAQSSVVATMSGLRVRQ